MSRLARRPIAVAGVVLCVVAANATSPVNTVQLQAGSLCEKGEKIVFSCPIGRSAKIVSLCSSNELTKERGYLQYRFGLSARHEQGITITPPNGKAVTLTCRGKAKAQYGDLAEVFPEPE